MTGNHLDKVVSIIGGGATAIAFLHSYLRIAEDGSDLPTTIYLFEGRRQFGPGAAYESDLASNLLNTKAGFITPFQDRPGDFFKWLSATEPSWRSRYPSLRLDEHSYAPRALFGEYLESQLDRLAGEAAERGITVVQINAEVTDVFPAGHSYAVSAGHHSIISDYVFFACGGLQRALGQDEKRSERVFGSPYPVARLADSLPKSASVGIVGARLSCIDAVIGLIEQGHQGPISIHSRSGHFPSVRGTQGRITPRVLTEERIGSMVAARGKLSLLDLVGLVQEEIALQGGAEAEGVFQVPAPPQDLAAFLRKEIESAGGGRTWQAVLYSTNGIIERLWMALHEDEQAKLLDRYFGAFMAYRVSIPVENARKILSYLESGQVEFRAGGFDVGFRDNGSPVVTMRDQPDLSFGYDYLVNATGSARTVSDLDSALVNNLLHRGLVSPHRLGGIAVDTDTYCVVGAGGKANPQLRALGELTAGAFFFTSALEINARHARTCAAQFAMALKQKGLAAAA